MRNPIKCKKCGIVRQIHAESKQCGVCRSNELSPSLHSKFWKFVVKQDGCWGWTGHTWKGYGLINHRGGHFKPHRISYEIHKGEIPGNLWVLHSCDNRACSNPKHLFLGNNATNMRDAVHKGRLHMQKLSMQKASDIKKRYAEGGISLKALAKIYGVSDQAIWKIVRNAHYVDA